MLPTCRVHGSLLSHECERCGRPPGRNAMNRGMPYTDPCAGVCLPREMEPNAAFAAGRLAQTQVETWLTTSRSECAALLKQCLDYLWILLTADEPGGPRHLRNDWRSRTVVKHLPNAVRWAQMPPMEVVSSDDFQRLANGYFPPRRPFASDLVNNALGSRPKRARPPVRGPYLRKAATPADLGNERNVLPAPSRPELMPRDLFIRYAADLLYDGWPRATAPRVEFARRVAAEAFAPTATGMETEQTNPRRVRERLEANLQEQGRFEAWLRGMDAVVEELTLHPRTFGVRNGEVDLFQRSLPHNLAPVERDAAIWWFVRDWRCCSTLR